MTESVDLVCLGGSHHGKAVSRRPGSDTRISFPKVQKAPVRWRTEDLLDHLVFSVEREEYEVSRLNLVVEDEKRILIINGKEHKTYACRLRREVLRYTGLTDDDKAMELFFKTFYGPGF